MTPEKFIENAINKSNVDYGICPPPTKANKGMDVLIEHFLGKDWYTVMPLSTEQAYTEAIYEILKQNKKQKSLIEKLFGR